MSKTTAKQAEINSGDSMIAVPGEMAFRASVQRQVDEPTEDNKSNRWRSNCNSVENKYNKFISAVVNNEKKGH